MYEVRHWSCCGIFAVRTEVVVEWPKAAYKRPLDELLRVGNMGGISGMYFERSWRSIFTYPVAALVAAANDAGMHARGG